MIEDRELWVCALEVMRQRPDDAAVWVAERIGALAVSGDAIGVSIWVEIASRINRMMFEDEMLMN